MGTVRYMSPEQASGSPDQVGTQSDIYTLGVILYELVAGTVPYDTKTDLPSALKNIQDADPPRPSRWRRDLTSDLEAVIMRALAKEPERRYRSAGELTKDLNAWLDGMPVSAKSDSSFYVLRKLAMRHYYQTSLLLALLAGLVGFGGISYYYKAEAEVALADEQIARIAAQRQAKDTLEQFETVRQLIRQQAIGWLVLEWREGRLERAHQILATIKADSPERVALSYLLADEADTGAPFEDLLSTAPTLYHFIQGEKELRSGRPEAARMHFEQCADMGKRPDDGYEWLRDSARARLAPRAMLKGSTKPVE